MRQSPTVPQSPTVTTRPSVAAKKVYSLGDGLFSVYHHKHHRVVSQLSSGTVTILHIVYDDHNKFSFDFRGSILLKSCLQARQRVE